MNKLRGVVDSVNDNGVKIGETWYNYSKFHQVRMPDEGDLVEMSLEKDKWITELNVVQMAVNGADKQTKITRSGLLNTAISILRTENRAVTIEEVIQTAKGLEPYVNEPPYVPSGEDIPF